MSGICSVLLDVGDADGCDITTARFFFAALSTDLSAGFCLAAPAAYLDAVLEEANASPPAQSTSLEIQLEEHHDLESAAVAAALPGDARNFAEFMPEKLGCVLEIGAGFGMLARHLAARSKKYVCLDLTVNWKAAATDEPRIRGVCADMHHLPFADGTFDSIVANNVVEQLASPLRGLRELRRVLRPNGSLYVLFPLDGLNPECDLPAHHWKADVPSLRAGIGAAGMRVTRLETLDLASIGMTGSFPSCKGFVVKVAAMP